MQHTRTGGSAPSTLRASSQAACHTWRQCLEKAAGQKTIILKKGKGRKEERGGAVKDATGAGRSGKLAAHAALTHTRATMGQHTHRAAVLSWQQACFCECVYTFEACPAW